METAVKEEHEAEGGGSPCILWEANGEEQWISAVRGYINITFKGCFRWYIDDFGGDIGALSASRHFPWFVLRFSEYEESFRERECPVFSWVKPVASRFSKLPGETFSGKNISIPSPWVVKPWHCWKAGGWLCFRISKMRGPSQHFQGLMNGSLVPLAEEPTWKICRGDMSDGVCSLMLVWITVWWEREKEQPIQTILILFSQQSLL